MFRPVKIYFFIVLLGLISIECSTDVQYGIDKANDLLYRKQFGASDRLYRKLLRRIENRGDLNEDEEKQRLLVLDRLGKVNALYLHDYDQSIVYYQKLVQLYPKTGEASTALATIADIYHHKLGDLQAAIDAYQNLVSGFPQRNETRRAQLQIAAAYFQLKNYEQARSEAELVINRWPKSSEAAQARLQIANSFYVQERYAEAIATYESLLDGKPDNSLASLVLFELGNSYQELDQPDRALAYFYACLQYHPDPVLVQQKIRRVRGRLRRARPLPELDLPPDLRERLNLPRKGKGSRIKTERSRADPASGGAVFKRQSNVKKKKATTEIELPAKHPKVEILPNETSDSPEETTAAPSEETQDSQF